MSRFEIVGMNNCVWFAKAEKLADEIVAHFPTFEFHRQMLDRFSWNEYVEKMRKQRNWDIKRSPVIFEVLVELDGKARLIGDIDDFCEFVVLNFGIMCNTSAAVLEEVAKRNKSIFERGFGGQDRGDSSIFNLSIINAPVKLLELVLTQLLSPVSMVPPGLLFNIRIYDDVTPSRMLDGLIMELIDLASPNLFNVSVTTSLPMLFYQCNLLLLLEDLSYRPEEELNDWITRVEMTVIKYFISLNKSRAAKDCRVIIGGQGPQCYIAEIFRKIVSVHKVGFGQIVTAGQYVAQQAKCEISKITGVPAGCLRRIHAWGWPGLTGAYIEVLDGVVTGINSVRGPGIEIPLAEVATNCDTLYNKFSGEFLRLQAGRLKKTIDTPNTHMVMADSVITTIHLWLKSDLALNTCSKWERRNTPNYDPENPDGLNIPPSPVISLGVQNCHSAFAIPPGTFMVQPAICLDGAWKPLGQVSEKTHRKISVEISKLWKIRQDMIHRDTYQPGLCPDYDRMVGDSLEEELAADYNTGTEEQTEQEE